MSELPLDAYYDLSKVGAVAVAPDGERAAFTTTEYDPEKDEPVSSLFVVPTDGSRDPHRLTRVSGASSPTWSPSGDRLAFMANRDMDSNLRTGRDDDDEDEAAEEPEAGGDGGEDEEPKAQIWVFDLALGGDAQQITDFDEGVREFDWAPNGNRLVVTARDPTDTEAQYLDERRDGGPVETERIQHKLDGVGWTDTVTSHLFIVGEDAVHGDAAADADSARKLEDAYGQGAFEGLRGLQPDWGDTGEIAFISCREEEPDETMVTDVLTVSPDGGEATIVTDGDMTCNSPTWSPDGEQLAFSAGDDTNWCIPTEARVWDGDEHVSVTGDLDRTLARSSSFEWVDDETFFTLVGDEARTRVLRCDATDADWERTFEAQGDDRAITGLSIGGDTAGLGISHPSDGHDTYALPVSNLTADEEPDSLTRLSEVNAELIDEYEMPEVRRVEYENDGWEISGVLYHPPDYEPGESDPAPLVCAIHGGPVSYDEPVFGFEHAALTSRGYIVFRPNYRGGSSFGRKFCETLHGQWGTVEASDIAAGIREMIDRGWADEDRTFGYGFSYGGISQGFLVTQYPDLLTAAAPEHGIYDLRSAYGTDDSHVWMENEYGYPWENQDAIDASSAITDAGEIETPLLVTAGGDDWRCPPSQSEQLYVAAQAAGAECRLVVYEGEHHNIGNPDRAIHRLEELTAWYRRHDPAVEGPDAADPHGRENGDDE